MKEKTILERYLEILQSPRFHQVVVIAALQALRHYGYIDDFMANLLSGVIGTSVVVKTVDRMTEPKK